MLHLNQRTRSLTVLPMCSAKFKNHHNQLLDILSLFIDTMSPNLCAAVYELGEGKKSRSNDIYIPSEYNKSQVISFLEDLLHEKATPENPNIKILE